MMKVKFRKSEDDGIGLAVAGFALLLAVGLHFSGALEPDTSNCYIREIDGYRVCPLETYQP